MTVYPTLDEVLQTHLLVVTLHGGSLGVRDLAALESALARPQTGYYTDLIAEAAALMESLSQNHPFIDGNKRVAISATAGFLFANGYELLLPEIEAYNFLISLYESGRFRYSELESWLRAHAIPRRSSLR